MKAVIKTVLVVAGIIAIVLSLLGRGQSVSADRFAGDFLNGIPVTDIHDLRYWWRGSHAGYRFIARISAPPDVLQRIVKTCNKYSDEDYVSVNSLLHSIPSSEDTSWFELPETTEATFFSQHGANGYTSSYDHNFALSHTGAVLYAWGSGI